MLKQLWIKSIAVIDELNIEFSSGLSILSGETGAGKSIIIDSINLLKGERASKSIIRSGEDKAMVSGVFELSDNVRALIDDILGTETEDDLIISREINLDGKNTIRIDGMPANLTTLKAVGELLINIHGQHDNTSLLSVKTHMTYLDSFGGEEISTARAQYRELFDKCKSISEDIALIDTDEQEKLRRRDMLSFQISELDEAALEIGEDDRLLQRKSVLDNIAGIKDGSYKAYELLYGSEETTAHDMLWGAISQLEKIADFDSEINEVYDALSDIADNLDERVRDLRRISDNLSFDAAEAAEIEDRLELIYNLKRKYGSTIEEILEFYDKASEELKNIDTSAERLEYLKSELDKNKALLKTKAETLSDLRHKYAAVLSEKIMTELKDLNMDKVEFEVSLKPAASFKPTGTDEAEFMIRTNVGEAMAPLASIASGGELSRIMLAMKSVLHSSDNADTLIFDEIDTGVSGAAAEKIGTKLYNMSHGKLVLCITHLAQIAALADNHYLITKAVTDGRTSTKVELLDYDRRVEEIARTLGGSVIGDAARDNARQLLKAKKQ